MPGSDDKKGLLASQGQWILWPGRPKHSQKHPELAEGQPEGPLVQGNLASQFKDCNPSDHFMWSEVEREVNKHPHNILASLRVQGLRGNG